MFCSKCGKELSEGAQFCTSCGAPTGLQTSAETGAGTPTQEAVTPPPAEPPFPSGPLPPGPMPGQEPDQFLGAPKRRVSTPMIILIVLVALLVMSAAIAGPIIIVTMSSRQEAQKRTCQSNQRNVEAAIQTYAAMSPDENYPTSLDDLVEGDTRVLKSIPTCPSGDKPYIWVDAEVGSPPYISCPNKASHAL